MTRSTPPEDKTRKITVCDACLTASCWHGEFMCQKAVEAGTTTRTVAELDALAKEHPSHYSNQKIREVYGTMNQPANDTTLHLRLSPEECEELDRIVGWMRKDPVIGRLRGKLGREKAVRYAVGQLLARPPEHVAEGKG